ncbi:MAG: DsbE family thiol:disulfide interchange protein [Gammaproteobacteria bacterium]|nr:DsbE family thiol:disulfide interchange protein [Chromatiales bacterium]MDP6673903.1 DsbE family thiol:disulfide interchange protein [Gammaproteobacteria bacterium]
MNRFIVPIVGFAILVIFLMVGLNRDPTFVPSPLIGKQIPTFSLPRLDEPDKTVTDANLRGQFSIFNVWATWCSGCRQEHPVLNQIAAQGQVQIYGLNWKDDVGLASSWLQKLGNPYTANAFDKEGRVAIDWGVYGAPETFLIAPDGTVLYRHISPMTMDVWKTEFLTRIAAAAGETR